MEKTTKRFKEDVIHFAYILSQDIFYGEFHIHFQRCKNFRKVYFLFYQQLI